ncbi:MAG: hypothetical protein H7839_07660 [Magnetococcus sp. YQC-5]
MDNTLEIAEDAIINRHEVLPDPCINLINAFIDEINNPLLICHPCIDNDAIIPAKKYAEHDATVQEWLRDWSMELESTKKFKNSSCNAATQKDSENDTKHLPENINLIL